MIQNITFKITKVTVTQFKFANDAIRMEVELGSPFSEYQALTMYVANGTGVNCVQKLFNREPDQIINNY